jgi:hypothetical protein
LDNQQAHPKNKHRGMEMKIIGEIGRSIEKFGKIRWPKPQAYQQD